mgnify:CR=1 FL=1
MLTATAATEAALDIDAIKKSFENFDLATLLPKMDSIFKNITVICRVCVMLGPIILLVLGLSYLFLAPKEANYYFGYRCYYGMGSVHAWRFTQRIAGMILGGLGLILTVIMAVISLSFGSMAVEDLVWKTVWCLVWQAALSLLATLAINGLAMFWFNRKGELRRRPKKA